MEISLSTHSCGLVFWHLSGKFFIPNIPLHNHKTVFHNSGILLHSKQTDWACCFLPSSVTGMISEKQPAVCPGVCMAFIFISPKSSAAPSSR